MAIVKIANCWIARGYIAILIYFVITSWLKLQSSDGPEAHHFHYSSKIILNCFCWNAPFNRASCPLFHGWSSFFPSHFGSQVEFFSPDWEIFGPLWGPAPVVRGIKSRHPHVQTPSAWFSVPIPSPCSVRELFESPEGQQVSNCKIWCLYVFNGV